MPVPRAVAKTGERLGLLSLALITALLLVAFFLLEASDLVSAAGGV